MLFAHVTIMMIAVVITLQRPGESAVIPDYYDKAQALRLLQTAAQRIQTTGMEP